MKPIYELVTAAELKVGDLVRSLTEECDVIIQNEIEAERYNRFGSCKRLRRIPSTEDPRVLRRALEIACSRTDLHSGFDPVGECLDAATQELESEEQK